MVAIQEINLESEIINKKKQFIFQVEQSANSVLPNKKYTYYIYIKNVSGLLAENVHIKMVHPTSIIVDEPDTSQFIEIGDLKDGHSHLLKITARCTMTGRFTAHFICYSDISGMFYQSLEIHCGYEKYTPELFHRITVYNFSPYEDTYQMKIKDFNTQVTQQFKHQKLPYKAKESLFTPIDDYKDESQSFLDQLKILKNKDEHGYQYIGREDFSINKIESYEGNNLVELLNRINDKSQYIRSFYIRSGNNELENNIKQFSPNGFLHRFGLLSSEIYHNTGVLPTYNYMNEYLFRWAPSDKQPLNLYPSKQASTWKSKQWAGEGYIVYEYFDDDENDIHTKKEIHTFRNEKEAEECIRKSERYNSFYNLEGYTYDIQEVHNVPGVFFVNIPLSKIPSNFFILNQNEISTIVDKAKPLGLRGLVRYELKISFNHNIEYKVTPNIKPKISLDLGDYDKIVYWIQSLKYAKEIKEVCGVTMESMRLQPNGLGVYNGCNWDHDYSFRNLTPKPKVINKDPQNGIDLDMEATYDVISCQNDQSLVTTGQIAELLYLNNFDTISFSQSKYRQAERTFLKFKDNTKDIPQDSIIYTIKDINGNDMNIKGIKPDNFKLWLLALETPSNHVGFNLIKHRANNKSPYCYYINNTNSNENKIDMMRLPIESMMAKDKIESGIYFKDSYEKIHGLSAEFDSYLNSFRIKYSSSKNNNYKINKEGYQNIIGLAIKILPYNNENIIIMYIETSDNTNTKLHYFHHIIASDLKEIGVFIRNGATEGDGIPMQTWYGLPYYAYNEESEISRDKSGVIFSDKSSVQFQTPQYSDCKTYDNYEILGDAFNTNNTNQWVNLYRIDKAENSYAYIKNNTNNIKPIDDILLYIDDLEIPENSIVQNIRIKAVMESISSQTFCQADYKTQTNTSNSNTNKNTMSLEPHSINCYHQNNESPQYYDWKYAQAKENQNTKDMELYQKLINKNIVFDENLDFSLDYMQVSNKSIKVKKPFWVELSDFTDYPYNFNDIKKIFFVIEGYNDGPAVNIITQFHSNNNFATKLSAEIETGYFYKKIQVPINLEYLLDNINIRFRFEDLNAPIDIFNTHIDVDFRNKVVVENEFTPSDEVEFGEKKLININVIDTPTHPYYVNNGMVFKLSFDDMYPGDEYRIYSIEIDALYQELSTHMLINSDRYKSSKKSKYTTIAGNAADAYLSGQFYDDRESIVQNLSKHDINDSGFELSNKIYQSFEAKDDNITSIEIFPNGFYGSPDPNLKIKIYENSGTTPGKLIKEVNASGWVKSNEKLKYLESIKYNIPVNNLKVGEVYWFSFEVVNPNKNSGYYLEYTNETITDHKLIYEEDNDLRNAFACLKFSIYTTNIINGFNNIPTTQSYFNDPYISIGLNRGQGSISNLRVQKSNR